MSKQGYAPTLRLCLILFFFFLPKSLAFGQELSQVVAVSTGYLQPVVITDYDITLKADFEDNSFDLQVVCSLHNQSGTSIDILDFDLLAREQFYGVQVVFRNISRREGEKSLPVKFTHGADPKPDDNFQQGSSQHPKFTRVFLDPGLRKEAMLKLCFEYTVTHVDPTKQDLHYRILTQRPDGSIELCLITDFTWIPQFTPDNARWTEITGRNFFPKTFKPTWNISIEYPAGYEAMVLDGKNEEVKKVGNRHILNAHWITKGLPQVFIGRLDRLDVREEKGAVVFLLPPGEYNADYVQALGHFMLGVFKHYSTLFGPLEGKEIHVAATSGLRGGHGAYLGMTLYAPYLRMKKEDSEISPGNFFNEVAAHELAHSWWGNSISSYGRGTKFLRESLAEFSTWHLARSQYGVDLFKKTKKRLFELGQGKTPLFNLTHDSDLFSYTKGPLVLDMLRLEMTDEIFFKCLRQLAEEYKDSWATFTDFVSVCNRISNRDWMPFFHQWCYEGGYPSYRILRLDSKKSEEGWMTEVTIKNEGSAILRCPLELRGKDKKEIRFFRIPPGEELAFSYSLPFKVDEAVIDPESSIYQADEAMDCLKIPEGPMIPEEKDAIAESKIIRKQIQEGQSFNDRSTPLHSYLSLLSCLRFKDREALKQIHPLPLSNQDDLYLSDWEERLNQLDVLRAPRPPQNPSEGEFWVVYVKLLSSYGLYDVHFFLFWDGEWKRVGNLGRPMTDWRSIAERMKPQILALLKKEVRRERNFVFGLASNLSQFPPISIH